MVSIAVCDDDASSVSTILKALKNISLKHDFDLSVKYSHTDPVLFIDYIKNNYIDIVILDIDFKLDHMNGISIGKELRDLQKDVTIIFISARLERIFESYECVPFSFICKPSILPQLEETLIRFFKYKKQLPCGSFIKIKNSILNVDNIIYIEKNLSITSFYSKESVTMIYISFFELLNCLPGNFIQISKSYIVNNHFISELNIRKKYILLNNNVELKFSTKFLKEFGGFKICNQ